MALQKQLLDVPFGAGLAENAQAYLVNAPQLLSILNGVFTKQGTIRKRFGATALPTTGIPNVLAPNGAFDHRGELCAHTPQGTIALSQDNARWRNTSQAGIRPCEIVSRPRVRANESVRNVDSAVVNGLVCTVWEKSQRVWCEVREQDTGAVVLPPQEVNAALKVFPRVVAVGGRYFMIAGKDGTASTGGVLDPCRTKVCSIDTQTLPMAISAPTTVGTEDASSYDFVCYPGNASAHLVEADGLNVRVSEISGSPGAAPTLVRTSTFASNSGNQDYALAVFFNNETQRVLVANAKDAANNQVSYSDWTSGGGYGAWTTVSHAHTLPGAAEKLTLCDRDSSGGMWMAMYGSRGSPAKVHKVEAVKLTSTAGAVANSLASLPNFQLATKAFRPADWEPCIGLVYDWHPETGSSPSRSLQQTGLLCTIYSHTEGQTTTVKFTPFARFHQDIAAPSRSVNSSSSADNPGEDAWFDRHLPGIAPNGSEWLFTRSVIEERNYLAHIQKQAGNEVRFSLTPKPLRARASACGVVFNGGYCGAYDGVQSHESSLHFYPEKPSLQASTGGAVLLAEVSYKVVYEWTDTRGQLHRSAPSKASAVLNFRTIGTAPLNQKASATLQTTWVPPSGRNGDYGSKVTVVLYRRAHSVNEGGSNTIDAKYREVKRQLAPTLSDVVYTYITDDTIATGSPAYEAAPVLYTEGGVLSSDAPPAMIDVCVAKGRVFGISSEDPTRCWYTKLLEENVAPEWNGNLALAFPAEGGDLVAVEALDEKVVFFKSDRIYYVSGDGPTNTGTDDTFSSPQSISADTGCVNRSSVAAGPWGIVFESSRGLYLLDRGLSLTYIGGPVEDSLAGQTINAAVIVPERSEVRFTLGNQTALVWNYLYNQWSRFDTFSSVHACLWGGVYTRITSGYVGLYENEATYLDNSNGYYFSMVTAWIKVASIQGFARFWRAHVLGRWLGGANDRFQLQIGYDYEDTYGAARVWTNADIAALARFQVSQHIPRQKCESVRFFVKDIGPAGDNPLPSGGGYEIAAVTLEVGAKKGAFKLPAAAKK